MSIQAQIVNLLVELKDTVGLSYLFISHNLAVVRHVSDRVAIMYLGHLMEIGSHHDIYENPTHPYSQALLSAVPVPDPTTRGNHEPLKGDLPSPMDPPKGCRFNTRCPLAVDQCFHERPPADGALQRPPGGLLGELSERVTSAAGGTGDSESGLTARWVTFGYLFTLYFILGGAETMMSPLFPLVEPDLDITESNLAAIPGLGVGGHRRVQHPRRHQQPLAQRPVDGPGLSDGAGGRDGAVGRGPDLLGAAHRPDPAGRGLRDLLPARSGQRGPAVPGRGGQGHRGCGARRTRSVWPRPR